MLYRCPCNCPTLEESSIVVVLMSKNCIMTWVPFTSLIWPRGSREGANIHTWLNPACRAKGPLKNTFTFWGVTATYLAAIGRRQNPQKSAAIPAVLPPADHHNLSHFCTSHLRTYFWATPKAHIKNDNLPRIHLIHHQRLWPVSCGFQERMTVNTAGSFP